MAKGSLTKLNKRGASPKPVTLSVTPQGGGSQDIHVEMTRNLTVKKRRSQRRFAAFLFVVMFLLLYPMARDLLVYIRMNDDYRQLLQDNQALVDYQQQLEEERDALYSLEMVERMAREELDMVLPGESKVYQAIPTTDIPKRETVRSGEAFH